MQIDTANQPLTYIYALTDPRETDDVKCVRYVGKAKNTDRRFEHHLWDARNGIRTYCCNWIRQLLAVGLVPAINILETTTQDVAADRERGWIAYLRAAGSPLTNLTDGGDGAPGHKHSSESRAKMSAAKMGHYVSEECRVKMSAAMRGKRYALGKHHRLSEETKLKMSAAKMGHKTSDETRVKMSAAKMGNKNALGCKWSSESRAKMMGNKNALGNKNRLGHHASEETKLRMSAAHMGNKSCLGKKNALGHRHSEETKRKMSVARRVYWATQKGQRVNADI